MPMRTTVNYPGKEEQTVEIENLEIIIESDTERAVKDLRRFKRVLKELDKNAELSGLKKLHERLRNIASVNLTKQANALERMVKASKQLNGERIRKLAEAVKSAPKPTEPAANPLEGTTEQVGRLEKIKQRSRDIVKEWSRLHGHVADTEKAAKKTGKAFTAMTAIKTILMYSVLFSALNAITKGIKEGLDNVARASKEANEVLTQYKSVTLEMKNALGAAAIPTLKLLYPLLHLVADGVIAVANAVNILTSAMTGSKTYTRATKYVDDYVRALQKAKGLLGMDEINTVGMTYDYGKMFETAEIDAASIVEAVGALTALIGGIITFKSVKNGVTSFFTNGTFAVSKWGSAIGLAAAGAGLLATSITDIVKNGKSFENTLSNCVGILLIGVAAAIAGGGWIAIAIAALVAELAVFALWGKEITNWMEGFEVKAGKVFSTLRGKVKDFFDSLIPAESPFSAVLDHATNYVNSLIDGIESYFTSVSGMIRGQVGMFYSLCRGDMESFGEYAKTFFASLGASIVDFFSTRLNVLISAFESSINFIIKGINVLIKSISAVSGNAPKYIPELSIGRIPTFTTTSDTDRMVAGISGSVGGAGTVKGNGTTAAGLSGAIGGALNTASAEQNALLREQNALLERIAAMDPTVSVATITRGIDRMNRRAGRAVVVDHY